MKYIKTLNEAKYTSAFQKMNKLGYNDQISGRKSLSKTLGEDLGFDPKKEYAEGVGFDSVSLYDVKSGKTITKQHVLHHKRKLNVFAPILDLRKLSWTTTALAMRQELPPTEPAAQGILSSCCPRVTRHRRVPYKKNKIVLKINTYTTNITQKHLMSVL